MSDFSVSPIDSMEAVVFGSFKRARASLGVESFGMQVIDLPPNAEQYPEHDHAESGQEEVFVVLRGAGQIEIDGKRHSLDPETMVRVGPALKRKIWPGDEGMRVLALGGCPGEVYKAPDVTKLGSPDPGLPSAQPS
ncbi:MAG TPA: cupin domain-containing protein [Solirubrobacteraceae bacterium]